MRLSDFDTLSFDCYGTLIDWETGIISALSGLLARASVGLTRDEVLAAHARHESEQQLWTPTMPYSALLAVVFKRLAEDWDIAATPAEAAAYGRSVGAWPPFPDTAEALRYLKGHYRLVILSNVDNESFALSNAKLGVRFDAVYTAQDISSYKPATRNFDYMLEKLATRGVDRQRILHIAESLFHDHGPANALSLASCWIHRRHAQDGFGATMDPGTTPRVDFRFTSMAALAAAHRAEGAGPARP